MDRKLVKKTLESLRDSLRLLALGGEVNVDALWRDVQSGDLALEEFEKADSELANKVLKYCHPYIMQLGHFEGMIKVLKQRHPFLEDTYKPVGWSMDHQLMAAGRDLWLMCNLLEKSNANNESQQFPGSLSQSGGSGPLHEGGLRLQRDSTPEATPHGGLGEPIECRKD